MSSSGTGISEADALLEGLNGPQREAVAHVDGPLLVLAGPGSGKTRVITRRVAYLVRAVGIAPWQVLAITFTNKAAGEMRDRVAELLSAGQAKSVLICTFHSLGVRLLRQYGSVLGLKQGFSIYDSSDQQRAMKQALAELEISTKHFPPDRVLGTISQAKNELVDVEAFATGAGDFYSKSVAKLYRRYQEILTRAGALDFDDLLLKSVELIRHPQTAEAIKQRFAYVLIDEYQDTNRAQFILAHGLAAGQGNICATGDPDQSIYRWRGADIRNILQFQDHYPLAKVVRLEENYRSTKKILAVADVLIQNNTQRKPKRLFTENEAGEPVEVVLCADEKQEAKVVTEQLSAWRTQAGLTYGDMAVFYRVNSLSRVMEDSLRTAGIPYQIARGTAFYDRKEIKDALAYLRAVANPADSINLARIINTPARGISDTTLKGLQLAALTGRRSLYDLMQRLGDVPGLNARAAAAVGKFAQQLESWRQLLGGLATEEVRLREFVEKVLKESGLEDFYRQDKTDQDQERLLNLGELISAVQQFEQEQLPELAEEAAGNAGADAARGLEWKLQRYLEQVSLVSDVDAVDPGLGSVTLMTLHAAKGLEFAGVAIIGLEEGLLPHSQSNQSPAEIEEERRLCFVGITRARRLLTLTHTRYRTIFGQTQPTIPSRFLRELPEENLKEVDRSEEHGWEAGGFANSTFTYGGKKDSQGQGQSAPRKSKGEYEVGTLVRHPMFGLGRVTSVSASGGNTRVQVHFNSGSTKNLILEFAKLEKVSL
ncbi:MAG: UvrD-helicase domain-containing protein [Phycisphaeraceae bacterium]|nr:UvrD-helicase domain-containing protein [Phycisphaeraceae bacterium]